MITEHDTDVPGIAIVRSSRPWARTLHRYVVDHGGAIVRTRPLEERQAIEDEYDILIVDDISSFLTAHIVEELHRRGRRVLGVFDPDEFSGSREANTGKQRLLRLGADGVIEAHASPEEFVRVIEELAPPTQQRAGYVRSTPEDDPFADTSDPSLALAVDDLVMGRHEIGRSKTTAPHGPRGNIVAVLGASGGSGVTEVAVELARDLGRRGERTVIVDGDEMAPSIAQRLNLALHPNLRTAVDVVEHGTGRLSDCLVGIAKDLEVLVGIPHPKDWVELRGSDMIAVLEELSRNRPHVVVNASPSIEDLTMFGSADRFGVSRAVIVAADIVVVVCPPTPMGVARLLDKVADLKELADGKPLHVVVNRTQKSAFKRNEIAREIQRSFAPAGIHFLPADPRVERAAWEGTLVPSGDFTKAVSASLAPAIPSVALPAGNRGRNAPGGSHFNASRKGA